MTTVEEKIEILLTQYEGCYDLSIARMKVPELTAEEYEAVLKNDYFNTRKALIDAGIQETIMINLLDLANSEVPNIKLKATLELGKILYQKKFDVKHVEKESEKLTMPTIVMKGVYPDE